MGDSTASEQSRINIEEEITNVLAQVKALEELAATFISKTTSEEKAICQRALSLDSTINRLHSLISSLLYNKALDPSLADKLDEKLHKAKRIMADGVAASFVPEKAQGHFLKMFLGPISVRATRKDVQLKVKEEYNSYRDRTALLFLLFPSMLLILSSWVWNSCFPAFPVQLYQAWLLFLYLGLALRENILKANGSDIRPWQGPMLSTTWTAISRWKLFGSISYRSCLKFMSSNDVFLGRTLSKLDSLYRWIYHHYCAMMMALISLTWDIKGEECIQKQRVVRLFLQWAIMQGIAMLLQNRYQRQRLYTRIALGKAKRMDVVWGEAAGVDGQLLMLCPILFSLQGSEAYLGLMLLRTALAAAAVVSEWQVFFCGVLLVVMAVGNFVNTIQTLMAKSRIKAKAKRSKNRQES